MRVLISFLIAALYSAATFCAPPPVETLEHQLDDLKNDAASNCGKPDAFGALQRLPPVRIVVYDAVTNSFGFVRPCIGSDNDQDHISRLNADRLDRERLALTTQKIRLLVLPYNARTTHLTLVKTNGKGVEFDPFFSQTPPPAAPAPTDTGQSKNQATTPPSDDSKAGAPPNTGTTGSGVATEQKNKKPPKKRGQKPPASQPTNSEKWRAERKSFLEEITSSLVRPTNLFEAAAPQSVNARRNAAANLSSNVKPDDDPAKVLGRVSALFEGYRESAVKIIRAIDTAGSDAHCVSDGIALLDARVSHELMHPEVPFSLAYDRTLADVLIEVHRRHEKIHSIIANAPRSCVDGAPQVPVDGQIRQLETILDGAHADLTTIGILLDSASDALATLRAKETSDAWKKTLDAYDALLSRLNDFHAGVQKRIEDTRKTIDGLLPQFEATSETLEGPAAWLQRRNYPPLGNGESITFTFQRTVIDPKATTPATVDQGNEMELRSASSDPLRITMGMVKSNFRNPTFKAGPDQPALDSTNNPLHDASGNPIMQHQIQFLDENNGATLPAVFVHNYWTRRSAWLQPTLRERVVPTLSLGVPLSNSDPLQQLLLGLDWELIPGCDLNVGGHFGKANRLDKSLNGKPLHVGDFIPSTIDTSDVQSKRYTAAFYFGLSLNSDAFAALMGSRKSP